MDFAMKIFFSGLVLVFLSGCGFKGDLYLPKKTNNINNNVEKNSSKPISN